MSSLKEKVDLDGRISIKKVLDGTNIKTGDMVEIIPGTNRVILKVIKRNKPKGVIERVAGKWKDRPDLVEDLLSIRDEDDRDVPGHD